jgi:hypothetical protein
MGELLQAELLDHVIPEDALTADIAQLGGPYKVGKKLRIEMDQKAARDWLLNCLNPNHAQNLTQSQIALIVGWAREIGSTHYIEYWASANSMSKPVKITPEDEKDKLQRMIYNSMSLLEMQMAEFKKIASK